MAPQDVLAKVWILLQTRIDICSIVLEVLGHFELASVEGPTAIANTFSFFVWMKVIYDLQRTYSQSSSPSPESLSYLLPPRILFMTIRYVLNQRSRLDQENLAQRYFVARVLLSGLRALQLRGKENEDFPVQEMNQISILLDAWRGEADGIALEQFVLSKCRDAISQIRLRPKPTSVWHIPASGSCELRDNHDVLYGPALTGKIKSAFVDQLERLRADDESSFWALFDMLWAAEAGYIQWSADKLDGKDISDYKSEMGDLVDKIEITMSRRYSITVLLNYWSLDLGTSDPSLVRRSLLVTKFPINDCTSSQIGTSLESFHVFLGDRQRKLVDYNSEIRKLSTGLQRKIESWIRQESSYGDEVLLDEGQPSLETAYVLKCPQLHVVPEHELRSRIDANKHKHIFNNSNLLSLEALQIHCPRCPQRLPTTIVTHARMIEPLQYLSVRLAYLAETSNTSQELEGLHPSNPLNPTPYPQTLRLSEVSREFPGSPSTDTFSGTDEPSVPLTPSQGSRDPDPLRRISTGSQSTSTTPSFEEKGRGGRKKFSFPWHFHETLKKPARVETPKAKPPLTFQSCCFSTDGRTLILWDKSHIYNSIIPTQDNLRSVFMWDWKKFSVPGAMFVAGGRNKIAAIHKVNNQYMLRVCDAPSNPTTEPLLNITMKQDVRIRSIAMSLDDNFVAVGSDREVVIYDMNNSSRSPRTIMVSTQANVNSQRVNFSRDGKKVVVATRKHNGQTEIILDNHLESQEVWPRNYTGEQEITDQDHGLSAVFYDDKKRRVVLTSYTNKHYNLVHSRKGGCVAWNPQDGKLQAAVPCASGSEYILLNGTGSLYKLNLDHATVLRCLASASWKAPKSSAHFVALAAPEDSYIYCFRIENNDMILEVIREQSTEVREAFKVPLPYT